MTRAMPVIIDTDPGVDDALALILALRSPELNVLGLTTVFGNVAIEKTTQNACRILDLLDRPHGDPPIIPGSPSPLTRPFKESTRVHGEDGLGDSRLPHSKRPVARQEVVSFILEQARRLDGELRLITLGPLTNAARVLMAVDEPHRFFAGITVMGGAVAVPGNRTPVAEFNIMSDPEAASIVFGSGVSITLVGLDVTHSAVFGEEELAALPERTDDPVPGFVRRVIRPYFEFYRKNRGLRGAALHDPLAVAAVVDPGIVETERLHVVVETQGRYTTGMVVADRRYRPANEPNVSVATRLDYERFRKLLLTRLEAKKEA